MAWIAVFEEIDLIELRFRVFMRISGDAMVDGEWDVPVLKEGHHVVHIFEWGGTKRDDAGFASGGDAFDEHPVVGRLRVNELEDGADETRLGYDVVLQLKL